MCLNEEVFMFCVFMSEKMEKQNQGIDSNLVRTFNNKFQIRSNGQN